MIDATSGHALGPVQGRERLAVLDILRGFALFGILIVNITHDLDWFEPYANLLRVPPSAVGEQKSCGGRFDMLELLQRSSRVGTVAVAVIDRCRATKECPG